MASDSIRPVLGVGEVLWDNFPEGRQLGGAPGNFVHHVQQQGLRATLVSSVGQDPEGDDLIAALQERGLDTSLIQRRAKPTGRVNVELDDSGKPTYDIAKPAAWDHIYLGEETMEAARSAGCLCFGSLGQRTPNGRATVVTMLEAMPADGLRVFDVNLRPPWVVEAAIKECLLLTNVFKLSDDELQDVAMMLDLPSEQAKFCDAVIERFDLKLLILTRGGEGSILQTPDDRSEHGGVEVEVVSTVGAGDSFTAGVVAGWQAGMKLEDLHDHATRLSGFVCTQAGAMPELPDEFVLRS